MKKLHSQLGLWISLAIHGAIFATLWALMTKSVSSPNIEQVNSISIEMFMANATQPEVAMIAESVPVEEKESNDREEVPMPVESKPQEVKKLPPKKPNLEQEKTKIQPRKEQPKPQTVKAVKAIEKGQETKQGIVAKAMPNSTPNHHAQFGTTQNSSNVGKNGNGNQKTPTVTTASTSDINAYKAQIQRNLQQKAQNIYPQREKLMRKTGIVTISFSVSATGQLVQASVVQSSGNTNLDNAAIKAALSTQMASPPPNGFPKSITVPIRFSIS